MKMYRDTWYIAILVLQKLSTINIRCFGSFIRWIKSILARLFACLPKYVFLFNFNVSWNLHAVFVVINFFYILHQYFFVANYLTF